MGSGQRNLQDHFSFQIFFFLRLRKVFLLLATFRENNRNKKLFKYIVCSTISATGLKIYESLKRNGFNNFLSKRI